MNTISLNKIFILFIFCSCSQIVSNSQNTECTTKVISYAKVLTFDSLNATQKAEVGHCSYFFRSNWRDTKPYNKNDAYFVKIKLNNKALAKLSESKIFPIEKLLNSNPFFLYGKYHNEWIFHTHNGYLVYPTEKFGGHRILELKRKGDFDYLVVGPLPQKPSKLIIGIYGDSYGADQSPEYIFTSNLP